jgi:hypothetical protein
MVERLARYVVWDGETERVYRENPLWNDCVIAVDGRPISVQKVRSSMIQKGVVVTVVFACKRGQGAAEGTINGKNNGVFSHFWLTILENHPTVTFRDGIRLVNEFMKKKGFIQRSEVVCRSDILDMNVNDCTLRNAAHATMILDMCRTKPSSRKRKRIAS